MNKEESEKYMMLFIKEKKKLWMEEKDGSHLYLYGENP